MKYYKMLCQNCMQKLKFDNSMIGENVDCPSCGDALEIPRMEMFLEDEIENYQIQALVGSGSTADVYLATHTLLKNEVALKLFKNFRTLEEEQRFKLECEVLGQLNHPNIVKAFDAGYSNSGPYIIMNFCAGKSLKKIHNASEEFILDAAWQLASAMEYAWNEFNLLHRDLKPENVILTKSHKCQILDFGLAKTDVDLNITQPNITLGSPYYMSPEQFGNSNELTCQSDMYSLGAVLYHLVTNEPPMYHCHRYDQVLYEKGRYIPFEHAVPKSIEWFINKMMSVEAGRRPANWSKVKDLLKKLTLQSGETHYELDYDLEDMLGVE